MIPETYMKRSRKFRCSVFGRVPGQSVISECWTWRPEPEKISLRGYVLGLLLYKNLCFVR